MATGQRRSSLLFHLGQAHTKISSLEDYIRERERQFRSVVGQFERSDSRSMGMGGTRLRRVGLSHNLLHLRSMLADGQEEEDCEDVELYAKPLDDYACLKITRATPLSDTYDDITPFTLHRLVSREYHVGKGGVVIGTGAMCGVRLPSEANVEEQHVAIEWRPASSAKITSQSGHFVIRDLTRGKRTFHVSRSCNQQSSNEMEILSPLREEDILAGGESTSEAVSTPLSLPVLMEDTFKATPTEEFATVAHTGLRFVAGRLEFSLTALPPELLYTLKMFDAAKRGSLEELKSILESSKNAELVLPYVSVSQQDENRRVKRLSIVSVMTNQGVDVNVEYQVPSYSDNHFFAPGFQRRRSSAVQSTNLSSPLSPSLVETNKLGLGEQRLLLHIAIEQNNLEMVKFLLSEKANVNLCVGELKRSGLHLAAQLNLPRIVAELLRSGGDVEVMDSLHRQPLSLTSNYQVRKLLVSTVLLCAAAEVGDYGEVARLLSSTDISPNACGLRHKNSLHLASTKGHTQIVQCLLLNGADVNAKGGTRQRTPLHYASLNDHVDVAVLLLEAGANEFIRDVGGYTPLNLSNGGKMCKLLHKVLLLCMVQNVSSDKKR